MAIPVTEIAYITLRPGVDLKGPTSEATAWQKALATVSSQNGFQRCYYGQQLEDPSLLLLVIDWDSKESHLEFIADPSYGAFKKGLASLMEDVHIHHITQPDTQLLGSAPVMEVATFHEVEPGMLSNIEKFAAAMEKEKPNGYHGGVIGQVLEKIVRHKDVGKEDVKPGDAIVILAGWDSKETHLEFRETELFKENIGLLREKNGGAEVAHVPFKAF